MGMGMDGVCLTVLQLPLRTCEASGDRHCRSRSTGETVVWCSVLCTLIAAVTLHLECGWGGREAASQAMMDKRE